MKQYNTIYPIERIVSSGSYLTTGLIGFIWLIIAAVMKKSVRPFLMYHILQSIFISIAYYIIFELYKLLFVIPIINRIVFLFDRLINYSMPLFFGYSVFQIFAISLILYLVITSFCGKYTYIPWVSDIIKSNTIK